MVGLSRSLVLAIAVAFASCASTEPLPAQKPVVANAPSPPAECSPTLCSPPGYARQGRRCLPVCNPPCPPDTPCTRPNFCDEDSMDKDLDDAIRQRRHDGGRSMVRNRQPNPSPQPLRRSEFSSLRYAIVGGWRRATQVPIQAARNRKGSGSSLMSDTSAKYAVRSSPSSSARHPQPTGSVDVLRRSDFGPRRAIRSSASRIFRPSVSALNGFWRKWMPGLRTPCWLMASSV